MERRRYEINPAAVEVMGNAVLSVAEEMGEVLVKTAYSDNIKERKDDSCAIFDAEGRILAQAMHIPMHLSSLVGIVAAVVQKYPKREIREGDMFIGNDPYTGGGSHLPDIVITAPVLYKGVLVGFVANVGHHADLFDRGGGENIWQEGLRIPPTRIIKQGEMQKEMMDFILLNCQLPRNRLGDFRAQFAANLLGTRRMQELCDRHGVEHFLATMEELLNYTERRIREGIRQIPDGVYAFEDYLDSEYSEQPLKLVVTVTKDKDDIALDFTGCPPQILGPINMIWTALQAACFLVVKAVIDPEIPPNAGFYRAIRITASKGTIVNCVEPAAVWDRGHTTDRVVDLIFGALAKAVPERVRAASHCQAVMIFHGIDPRRGEPFSYYDALGGGFGARATKDGLDGVQVAITNSSNLPIEALESVYPLMVRRYELITDSCGAGRWRGGMGFVRHIQVMEGELGSLATVTRGQVSPGGLLGGKPGSCMKVEIFRSDGSVQTFHRGVGVKDKMVLSPGEGIATSTAGGGGYGSPKERDRWCVMKDLRDGRISRRSAVEDYNLTPEEVDQGDRPV